MMSAPAVSAAPAVSVIAAPLAAPVALTVNGLSAPLGVGTAAPMLAWQSSLPAQTGYQIQVAPSAAQLAAGQGLLWDSAQVTSSSNSQVGYRGSALPSGWQVWWQVRVWSSAGATAWSAPSTWEMGLLARSDWAAGGSPARWISSAGWAVAPAPGANPAPMPLLVKHFAVAHPVTSARLYIAGVGVYAATINGTPVSKDVLAPGYTTYGSSIEYADLDVTSLLAAGTDSIGISVGPGVYDELGADPSRYRKFIRATGPIGAIARLVMTLDDGTTQTVVSDTSWGAAASGTTLSDWYGGEDFDARRQPDRWDRPDTDVSSWRPATEITAAIPAQVALVAQSDPGVQVVENVTPVSWTRPTGVTGPWVADLGVNMAGWFQLSVAGPAGTVVSLRPAELLKKDGTVDQSTVAPAGQILLTYTLSGRGTESWHPQFQYDSGRYVQISGLPAAPTAATLTGLVLRAANPAGGTFNSAVPLINNIHKIINRAIQGNMQSVLTDCPSREKLGWLEQAFLVFPAIADNYRMDNGYGAALVAQMAAAQTPAGLIPDIAPEFTVFPGGFRDDPNWGSALIQLPMGLYQRYGDVRTMATFYPNMVAYLNYLTSRAPAGLYPAGLGDWFSVEGTTPAGLVSSIGYQRAAQTLSKIAGVLGKTADRSTFAALAAKSAAAINRQYLRTDGTYGPSQGGNALALAAGIVPPADIAAAQSALINNIRIAGWHLLLGEIALPSALQVLSDAGADNVIFNVVSQTTSPSYGFQVTQGATSLTERWDGPKAGASQNHLMLGSVDDWFTGFVAGIRQDPSSVGYRSILIDPTVTGNLASASGSVETPQGTASVTWSRFPVTFSMTVVVPGNTTATVHVPSAATAAGTVAAASGSGRVTRLGDIGTDGVWKIGTGSYSFTVTGPGLPPSSAALGTVYSVPYNDNLYRLVGGVPQPITFAQWRGAGYPTPQRVGVVYWAKYSWSPQLYAVLRWGAGGPLVSHWLTGAEWTTAGHPKPVANRFLPGSSIVQWGGRPDLLLRDPTGGWHKLTMADWMQVGHPAYAAYPNQKWMKMPGSARIIYLTAASSGVGDIAGYAEWAGAGYPAPLAYSTIPGSSWIRYKKGPQVFLRLPGGAEIWVTAAEWKAAGNPRVRVI